MGLLDDAAKINPIVAGAGAVTGIVETLIESGKVKKANKEMKRLFSKRKAFQTPQEVFDILNMSQYNASSGFSGDTLNYLTGEASEGLAAGLGTAKILGADPNQLSGMIDQYYGDIFKIGAESDLIKMRKFNDLTGALQLVAANKEAEWASKENIIKDQMQAVAQRISAGQQGINSGLNFAINSAALLAQNNMYREPKPTVVQVGSNSTMTAPTTSTPGVRTPSEIINDRNQIQ